MVDVEVFIAREGIPAERAYHLADFIAGDPSFLAVVARLQAAADSREVGHVQFNSVIDIEGSGS